MSEVSRMIHRAVVLVDANGELNATIGMGNASHLLTSDPPRASTHAISFDNRFQ